MRLLGKLKKQIKGKENIRILSMGQLHVFFFFFLNNIKRVKNKFY
jgi:hypothetical protein